VLVTAALALAVALAAIVSGLGGRTSVATAPPAASDAPVRPEHRDAVPPRAAPVSAGGTAGDPGGGLGDDGDVPDGVTVFDDEVPAVTRLDPDLLAALRRAATDAAGQGVTFYVTSGWRSPEYQDRLLREAVAEYGSAQEAARWVATADTSPHVHGVAIDVGRWNAMEWLSAHGVDYGLCQIYRNEPWHYELRPDAVGGRCPAMYADPTHDPRMQR
jgi:D-alanyl-D-alanine carboxypeptidase